MTVSSSQPVFRTRTKESLRKCNYSKFTQTEDQIIAMMVDEYTKAGERIRWCNIANKLFNKTGSDVSHRWNSVLNPEIVKGHWTPKEDLTILNWVKQNGAGKWNKLQRTLLPHRCGKQLRERWVNILSPSIQANDFNVIENVLKNKSNNQDENIDDCNPSNKSKGKQEIKAKSTPILSLSISSPWTKEEDELIMRNFIKVGPKWNYISSLLKGRSENSVKNRWQSINKQLIRIMDGKDPILKRGPKKKQMNDSVDRSILMMKSNELKLSNIDLDDIVPDCDNKNIGNIDELNINFIENTLEKQSIFSLSPIALSFNSQPILNDHTPEIYGLKGRSTLTFYDN